MTSKLKQKLKGKKFKDYFSVFRSTVLVQILGLVRGFIVAKFLGPGDYGFLTSIRLVSMLEKFGNFGFQQVVNREVAYLRGQKDPSEENISLIMKTGYSSEILLSVILGLIGVIVGLCIDDPKTSFAIIIASTVLAFAKTHAMLMSQAILEKKFQLYGNITLWTGVLCSALIIAGVPFGGIWCVLSAPLIQHTLGIVWFNRHLEAYRTIKINGKEFWRQFKIGLPLTIHTLALGSYKYAERILVLAYFSVYELGLFGLAMTAMNILIMILATGVKVRNVHLSELLGAEKYQQAHKLVIRETALHMGAATLIVIILWPILDFMIPIVLDEYVEAIVIIQILIVASITRNIAPYAAVVLKSPLVNKQNLFAPAQAAASVVFVIFSMGLDGTGHMTLVNLTILNVCCYTLWQVWMAWYYYRYFVKTHVKSEPSPL